MEENKEINKISSVLNASGDQKKLLQSTEENAIQIFNKIRNQVVANVNPKNWGVKDYTSNKEFNAAYIKARRDGEKEFIRNAKRFSTNYNGTPKQQLNETGITDDRIGIKGILETRAYNTIKPSDYERKDDLIDNFVKNINRFSKKNLIDFVEKELLRESKYRPECKKIHGFLLQAKKDKNINEIDRILLECKRLYFNVFGEDDPYSEDGRRIYLGMPQKYNTFKISDYRPANSRENKYYYCLPKSFKEELLRLYFNNKIKEGPNSEDPFSDYFGKKHSQARVLSHFKVTKGRDEKGEYISYYDIYDLNIYEKNIGRKINIDTFVGRPFEIYDRIYLKDYKK